MNITIGQIKVWVGELYITKQVLEEEVAALKKENDGLKKELAGEKDADR